MTVFSTSEQNEPIYNGYYRAQRNGIIASDSVAVYDSRLFAGYGVRTYYSRAIMPMKIDDNFYFHRAVPWEREPVYHQTDAMGITFAIEGDRVMLCYEDTGMLEDGCQRLLDTEALGVSFQTESKYTDPDNRPYTFDRDMLNHFRASRPTAGPLELGSLKAGKITLEY